MIGREITVGSAKFSAAIHNEPRQKLVFINAHMGSRNAG